MSIVACDKNIEGKNIMYFNGSEAEKLLEVSIENDDAVGISQAIEQGVDLNTHGLHGVTPLIFAVGHIKKKAVEVLLRHDIAIGLRDKEGDSAITLAVLAYKKSPELLVMILNAGGDPNTLLSNGDPIIVHFLNDVNFSAVELLKKSGANIDARNRSEDPLVISYAISEDWDAVWALLELGAQYDYPKEGFTWMELFSTPDACLPTSPLWESKVKAWKFLKSKGQIVPSEINDLVGQIYWDYIKDNGLEKPHFE